MSRSRGAQVAHMRPPAAGTGRLLVALSADRNLCLNRAARSGVDGGSTLFSPPAACCKSTFTTYFYMQVCTTTCPDYLDLWSIQAGRPARSHRQNAQGYICMDDLRMVPYRTERRRQQHPQVNIYQHTNAVPPTGRQHPPLQHGNPSTVSNKPW